MAYLVFEKIQQYRLLEAPVYCGSCNELLQCLVFPFQCQGCIQTVVLLRESWQMQGHVELGNPILRHTWVSHFGKFEMVTTSVPSSAASAPAGCPSKNLRPLHKATKYRTSFFIGPVSHPRVRICFSTCKDPNYLMPLP